MITLIGSLLGFITSAFPDLLRIYKDRTDRIHELEILDRQMEMMRAGHQQRLEEIQVQANTTEAQALYQHARASGTAWVDALAGSVRPVITYAFFGLYALVKLAQWFFVYQTLERQWAHALVQIWDTEDQALFATVIAFWFGHRMLSKKACYR